MKSVESVRLGPLGVARTLALGGTRGLESLAPPRRGDEGELVAAVRRALEVDELRAEDITLAWEMAEQAASDARASGRALPAAGLFALVLLVLDAATRGSTRWVVRGRREAILSRAAALGLRVRGPEVAALERVLAQLGQDATPARRTSETRTSETRTSETRTSETLLARTPADPRDAEPRRKGRKKHEPTGQLALAFESALIELGRSVESAASSAGGAPVPVADVSPSVPGASVELPATSPSLSEASRSLSEVTSGPSAEALALRERLARWGLVVDDESVALARWASLESRIDALLWERDSLDAMTLAARRADAERWVARLAARPLVGPRGPITLTHEQTAAVAAALAERTLVITGGPGTGKTSIIVTMLRALVRRDGLGVLDAVALAAPTGKAADRMGEAVRRALASATDDEDVGLRERFRPPVTLHRLLGYRPRDGGFRAHRHNRLAARVVIIDEASMIDAALFERLTSALADDATFIVLGDPEQLPSVDPGAVLRDLVAAARSASSTGARVPFALAELTLSHRMDARDPHGAHVLGVARACTSGALRLPSDDGERASTTTFRLPRDVASTHLTGHGGALWVPLERGGAGAQLERLVVEWVTRHAMPLVEAVAEDAHATTLPGPGITRAVELLGRARLLTVTRRDADELNAFVGARLAHALGEPFARGRLLPGEPVLVTKNDYDEDLWNGDSGVVFRDPFGELRVAFRRGSELRQRPLAAIAHLVERAHASTVHKAQGSEHDEVLLVLPSDDSPLCTREIVYTAITRARTSAIVAGSRAVLSTSIARSTERDTRLCPSRPGRNA